MSRPVICWACSDKPSFSYEWATFADVLSRTWSPMSRLRWWPGGTEGMSYTDQLEQPPI